MTLDDVLARAHQRLVMQPDMSAAGETYSDDCLSLLAPALCSSRALLDQPYGDHPAQRLDVYLPSQGDGPWPVLIFLHGGGWTNGTKEWNAFMAPALSQAGIALVSPSYRLLPEVNYPTPVDDCAAAVCWVAQNANRHNLSASHLVIGGHSAGGQIAALLCTSPTWLEKAGIADESIRGCYAVSATFNRRNVTPTLGEAFVQPGPADAIQPDSPLALADQAHTRFRLVWGTAENPRVDVTGRLMQRRLEHAGCEVEVDIIQDGNHFSMHLDHQNPDSHLSASLRRWLTSIAFFPQSGTHSATPPRSTS